MEDRKYDVAISFLSQDEPLARSLYEQLSENLSVFIFSKRQEEIAGTNGLETFRLAFRSQSRVALVLYRDRWGQTPWTRVEEQAITDRMLHEGWKFLLFVRIDPDSSNPPWIPENAMYLDYAKYGAELVGAIKLRVQELGGELKVETAAGKARRMKAIAYEKAERDWKLTQEAPTAAPAEWAQLRRLLDGKLAEIKPDFELQNEAHEQYIIRTTLATLRLHPRFIPATLSQIVVETYIGRLLFRDELRTQMYLPGDGPQQVATTTYFFDYDAAYGWCWRDEKGEFSATESLCELLLKRLLEIHQKIDAGEIQRRSRQDIYRTAWS